MSSAEFKALSQDELRKRLYQTFKNRGVLDTLKTQLRNQLIHELMNPILSREILPKAVSSECSSLITIACNSLVADHLRRCSYEYTLSVFYPESGLEKDKELTMQDLLRLIRIDPMNDHYKKMISDSTNNSKKGFLIQILTELIEYSHCKETCNSETQTSPALPGESLAEKLQLIDEQFADMYPQRHLSESFHVKLAEYKREIEQQLQAEMSEKIQHFKEVEIAKIKMDERAQFQKEISELRREFQRDHQAKSEALTSRERNAIERLHKQQEIDAKEIYLQRQTLLKDIETVRAREEELKKRIETFEIACQLQESKNKTVADALHSREVAVKNIEEMYDQKLKNELLKYQLELKEEYIARTKKVAESERELKEKAMILQEETISLNSKKQELKQAISRAKELELEIDSVKAQVLLLTKQNQLLTEKLKGVSDYPTLKEEKIEYQIQNKLLEQQLEEAHSENQRLQDKLSRPSSELVVLQAELKRIEHARKLEHEEFETQKHVLEKQVQNEVDHGMQLKSQLSEYENTIRKLNTQIEELKLQWKQMQTALENEVYRNPKPSLVDRSIIDLIDDKDVPQDIYFDRAFLKTQPATNIGMGTASPSRCNPILRSSMSPDSDLEFVANTKVRIKELEREAECLEEAYRNYQHKVIQRAVGPAKISSSQLPKDSIVASQQKKRFTQSNLYSQEFPLHCQKRRSCEWTPGNGDRLKAPLSISARKAVAPRRLSSTPVSKAKRNISKNLFNEDTVGPSLVVPIENADQPLSPILRTNHCSSPDSVSSSPVPNKHKLSLYNERSNHQNIRDTANPAKLLHEDSGDHNPVDDHQEDIPEQLRSNMSHPSGDVVSWKEVPASVHATGISQEEISGAEKTALEGRHSEEQKEQEWEEERAEKKQEDKRQNESLGREQGQVEKLEKETHVQESLETNKEIQNETVTNVETSNLKAEEQADTDISNPLEKYMKILQENQDNEQEKKNAKKEATDVSSERLLGSEREESFSVADTLNGGSDEDFW